MTRFHGATVAAIVVSCFAALGQEPNCEATASYVEAVKAKDAAARLAGIESLGKCGPKAASALGALTDVLLAQEKRHAAGVELNRLLKIDGPIMKPEALEADAIEAAAARQAIRQVLGIVRIGVADPKVPDTAKEALRFGQAMPSSFLAAPYEIKAAKFGILKVSVATPYLRVAMAAAEAAAKSRTMYRPFVEPQVTPDLVAPDFEVRALSSPEGDLSRPADNVEHVVVMKAGGTGVADAIQPLKTTPLEMEAQNRFGVKRTARSMVAVFPLAALVAGNEIRVVYSHGADTREQIHPITVEWLASIR